jgi:hypothetical protein
MALLNFNADGISPEPLIHLTLGRNKSEFRWTERQAITFDELATRLARADIGKKDGTCYTPATFTGYARKMDQAASIDIAVLDADCGHSLEEIEAAVHKRGWAAIIHSTFSHLNDRTSISAEAYDRWLALNPALSVVEFLLSKKGYLPRICKSAAIVDDKTIDGTRHYIVKHEPCPKFRVVLPLEVSWIAADYEGQGLANALWKERIGALASALGMHHDQSCTDVSRLFYFPRISEGQEFLHSVIEGERCPLFDLPEAAPETITAMEVLPLMEAAAKARPTGPQLVNPEHRYATDKFGEVIDLTSWARQYDKRFEIEKALRARAPEMIGTRRSGPKQHILCSNDADHITGGGDRSGTFVVSASRAQHAGLGSLNSGFIILCSHNGCSGRDRLDHIKALLETGKLSCDDLTGDEFLAPILGLVDASKLTKGKKAEEGADPFKGNIPPALYADLPGVLGEITEFMNATSVKPQPALNLGAALAFMAAAIGRKVQLQGWLTRPNIYVLGIAHSGAGKERPLSAIKQMAKTAGLFEKIVGVEDVASDSGIVTAVMANPSQVMLIDEVSYLISSANSRMAGPHVVNIISTLLKLYSSSHTVFKGKHYADSERKVRTVDQPCLSFYGCSTPGGLFSALSQKDITGGLLSRVVLFDAGQRDEIGRMPTQMLVPQVVTDWLLAWDRVNPARNPMHLEGGVQLLEPITVLMTTEAMDVADAFEVEMHAAKLKARVRGLDALYVRARENALKFALIRACAVPPAKSETGPIVDESELRVDAETMRWAVALSRATVDGMDSGARDQIADTAFEVKVRNLLSTIKRGEDKGATSREMRRSSAGRLPKKELEDVITTLIEARDIFYVANINQGKPGKAREGYVHRDFINFEPLEEG